jgi:single-stranded DNA-binding protein
MLESQVRTKVEIEGPLYVVPQDKLTKGKQKPVCKLVFYIKCTGEGEINQKDFGLQVITFGALAEQCQSIQVGDEVVAIGRISANRWISERDGAEKASQHIIAFRVGVKASLSGPITWFPGAAKKQKVEPKALSPEVPFMDDGREDLSDEEIESSELDESTKGFLHGGRGQGALGTAPSEIPSDLRG